MEKPHYTVQQYKKFNGQTVMKALQSMNYNATRNKLAKYIAACNSKREEDITDTVKRVLSDAVANGFLVTRGQSYQLPGALFTIQMDSRKKNATGKRSKSNTTKRTSSRRKVATKAKSKMVPAITSKARTTKLTTRK